MAKQINTRIQLKYDSYENWVSSNTLLKAGEIAIAYLTTAEAVKPGEADTQHPILFKVGPGNFNSLPWSSALAADVYGWAKAETAVLNGQKIEFKTGDVVKHEIDLSTFATEAEVNTIIANYYTKVQVDNLLTSEVTRSNAYADQAEEDALQAAKAYTDAEVEKITTGAGYATTTYVDNKVAAHETVVTNTLKSYSTTEQMDAAIDADVKVVNDALDAYKTSNDAAVAGVKATAEAAQTASQVSDAIDTKIAALDLANTYEAKGETAKVNTALESYKTEVANTLGNYYTKTDADTAFMTQDEVDAHVNKVITDAVEGDALTSLTELVQYINTHGGDAAEMATAIENIEKQLNGIDAGTGTVKKYVDDAITALKIGDYAKAADLTELAGRVAVLEAIDHDAYIAYADQAEADAKTYADGLAANYDAAGSAANAEAAAKSYADDLIAEEVNRANKAYDAKDAAATAKTEAITAAKTETESQIAALNIAQYAKSADLAKVATTGSTDDLEGGSEIWTFYCGTATEVV